MGKHYKWLAGMGPRFSQWTLCEVLCSYCTRVMRCAFLCPFGDNEVRLCSTRHINTLYFKLSFVKLSGPGV